MDCRGCSPLLMQSHEHTFLECRWCSSSRQDTSDSTTHLFMALTAALGDSQRHWLQLNDVGVCSDSWEAYGQICPPRGSNVTLLKITQRSRPSFVNPSVSSCMMTSLNQEPVIGAPCTQFDWRPVPLSICTPLLDSSFLHHPSFLKNPKVPPLCYTRVLGRHPLLPSTLKRRAVFAETLATSLIYFKALANMS